MTMDPGSDLTHQRAALPPDDAERSLLHNEVHARPSARIRLPAFIVYVAVLNEGISREQECEHLRRLPGQQQLDAADLRGNFLRLRGAGHTVKWERHSEFTRYSIVQPLPPEALLGAEDPDLLHALKVDPAWLAAIPGRTMAAISLTLLEQDLADAPAALALATRWLGGPPVLASLMGGGHSMVVTDFRLRPSGFERMLVLAQPGTSETRAGRISQRLLELETYRLMALRGLPVAKALAPMLGEAEAALVRVTDDLIAKTQSEQQLLDALIAIAARVERATAQHVYRFSATEAYAALVRQRILELREKPIPGTQTLGEFMQRRLSPAIATVAASAQRLASLSARTERASALLRTRVDIATETQNQQLLAQLTRGQSLQLKLQSTVEGLSIAAISYYVISLLLYGGKALKSAGLPLNPELLAGALIPAVLWAVWRGNRRIHADLHGH
ncbi:DUF3422 domain-containing protein [Paucibacter sp. APW11]|uniref:DUF3422 domain-containing protein n=1 Tax=Roseateles aquae TaxID=3077235 RepID=A0ABU3PC56_9BURK|nr:DUF3422 domain-containing protein [Paucibacter sp. APW11]MDT9000146.1 DUF3422 domain-containing protein [Paucibacter sp. APW11]